MLLTRLGRLARDPTAPFAPAGPGALAGAGEGPAVRAEAEVVEGSRRLRAVPVGAPGESGFTAFLDGIQRTRVALYHGPVPIVYAYVAAVVRARAGRRLATLYQEEREAVFYPRRYVDPAPLAAAGIAPEQLVATDEEGEPLPLVPSEIHARAAQKVDKWRESLEHELALRWCAEGHPGWLLVDGPLTLPSQVSTHPRVAGVVKTHGAYFFDGDDARIVFGLAAGERTSVFRLQMRHSTPVDSWYLRLRPAAGRDVYWGLVRVEVAARESPGDVADEVSRWLLAEARPLSLPDARWDRLLYPIHDCEEYLRARAPTWPGG